MGGWWLLSAYLAGWILILASPFARGRILLLAGTARFTAHLLLAAAILADAAVFPGGMGHLPVPLGAALVMGAASLAFRDTWILLGPGQERALAVLEHLCREEGVDLVVEDGTLVLKRLGTGVRRVSLAPGLGLVRMDRRRREPEVDRLGREWRRILSTQARSPS